MIFANRCDAGRRLAQKLAAYRQDEPIVLALPRGGVPVGYEVAHALGVGLDVLVVRKLGAPGHAELAIGAVTADLVVLDDEIIGLLGVPQSYIDRAVEREQREAARRAELFRGDRPPLNVRGRTVILVDDGIATGSTMLAAVDAVRRLGAQRIVVATPVAPPDAVTRLRAQADEVVCVDTPADFPAVGVFYEDFGQTSDEEVCRLLKRGQLEQESHYRPAARAS
jgi:predicted phosphoribosyltransferase